MQRVIDAFAAHLEAMVDLSCARVLAADIPFYGSLPPALAKLMIHRAFEAFHADLGRDPPTAFIQLMRNVGQQRATSGVAVAEILAGMGHGFTTAAETLAGEFPTDLDARIWFEQERARLSYAVATALADTYAAARERVVRIQADEILRLSTQVLRVHPGVLLLPLLGELPAERMQQITAALLDAVARHQARVVLLDLGGVPLVDATVAASLLRTTAAVRLLGATPLLVGVSPDVARTMISSGVALDTVKTLADLESGLTHARTLLAR
jgi:rsbT co-antagonist protein RsbR